MSRREGLAVTATPASPDWPFGRPGLPCAQPDAAADDWTADPGTPQAEAAARACRRCPIQFDCYAWALHSGQQHGVWGGRHLAQRRNRRAAS